MAAIDAAGKPILRSTAETPRTSSAPTISWAIWLTTPTFRSRRSWRSPPTASFAGCAATTWRARKYQTLAREYARHWMEVAADGDHYRIAFDKPEHLEPEVQPRLGQAAGPERLSRRGRPEGGRLLQEDDPALRRSPGFANPADQDRLVRSGARPWPTIGHDFEKIVSPIYDYLNQTTARLPFVDSYRTDDPAATACAPGR